MTAIPRRKKIQIVQVAEVKPKPVFLSDYQRVCLELENAYLRIENMERYLDAEINKHYACSEGTFCFCGNYWPCAEYELLTRALGRQVVDVEPDPES